MSEVVASLQSRSKCGHLMVLVRCHSCLGDFKCRSIRFKKDMMCRSCTSSKNISDRHSRNRNLEAEIEKLQKQVEKMREFIKDLTFIEMAVTNHPLIDMVEYKKSKGEALKEIEDLTHKEKDEK